MRYNKNCTDKKSGDIYGISISKNINPCISILFHVANMTPDQKDPR